MLIMYLWYGFGEVVYEYKFCFTDRCLYFSLVSQHLARRLLPLPVVLLQSKFENVFFSFKSEEWHNSYNAFILTYYTVLQIEGMGMIRQK